LRVGQSEVFSGERAIVRGDDPLAIQPGLGREAGAVEPWQATPCLAEAAAERQTGHRGARERLPPGMTGHLPGEQLLRLGEARGPVAVFPLGLLRVDADHVASPALSL
jgi:hypothetical protein